MRDRGTSGMLTRRHLTFLAAFLAVVASVDWRRGDYFSGSFDVVVVVKGALTLMAVALAWGLAQSEPRRRLGTGTLWWLGAVLTCSLLGGLTAGHLWASGIVAARVSMIAASVFFLLRAAPATRVITDVTVACGAVAAVGAATGLSSLAGGRLAGGIPSMPPNGLALLAGVVVLLIVWRAVVGMASWPGALTAALFLGIVWATGSRTVLIMLVAGSLVMLVQVRRPRVGLVVGGLVIAAAGEVVAVLTGAVAAFLARNGTGLSTVTSREVAWGAALAPGQPIWQRLLGGGLSVKVISVHALYRDTQPLDSTWMSLLVQTGAIGFAIAIGWALWALVGALRASGEHRVLLLGILVFLLGRSFLESGLFDATPDFILFVAATLLAEGGSRARLEKETAGLSLSAGAREAALR